MTLTAVNFLSFGEVGTAFGRWVCRWQVKELMAMFGCAEQTAKKWRQGQLPENKHMVAMVERWGEEFLLTIFAPVLQQTDYSLERQLAAIENRVSLIRERLADVSPHAVPHRRPADGRAVAVADEPGGADGVGVAVAARTRTKAARAVALALALIASLHGPIAEVLGDGDFGARVVRSVRVRSGRHEVLA